MFKKFKMRIFFLVFLFFIDYDFSWAGIKEDAEKIIIGNFDDSVEITFLGKIALPREIKKKIEMQIKQSFFRDHVFAWQILGDKKKEGKKVKSYAILDHVLGKVRPITFLVILNKKGIVEKTAVVKYRENHGGMVKAKRWNDQFIGLSRNSNFVIGEEISGISGATISVKSMTRGIHKVVELYPFILKSMQQLNERQNDKTN